MGKRLSAFLALLIIISLCTNAFGFVPVISGSSAAGVTPAPTPPADVPGATYFMNKTYASKPGGTESSDGATYTWSVGGAVSYDSGYNAIKHAAYMRATYAESITSDGEYGYFLDFIAPDTSYGEGVTYSFYAGSYKIASLEHGGKLYLAQQDSGKQITAGRWYRLRAAISLPSGDVTATVTDMTDGKVLATKTQTGRLKSITTFAVQSNITPQKYIYTQNWRLFKYTDCALYPSNISGPLFVVSPYYGESETNTAQYTVTNFKGNEAQNVKWSLKGATDGVSISDEGVLTVKSRAGEGRVKIVAASDGVSAEKCVNIVSRFEGAPNLLRLSGTSVSISGASNASNAYDGNFNTASANAKSDGFKYINMTLAKAYDIDVFRIYKDFGGAKSSAQVNCRVGSEPFGGKGWINAPLERETWNPSPAINSNTLRYGMTTTYHGIDVYEAELYSSYMRFSSIEMPSEKIDIPTSGTNTMKLTAKAENGSEIKTVTYSDGEVHPLKWKLLYPAEGVSINEQSGIISVSSGASPTVITVEATYFGCRITKSVKIGSSLSVNQDYDWLTFDKLSKQSPDNINYKMTLPCEGICGSVISWKSSKPEIISESGEVSLYYDGISRNITLTAEISDGTTALTKEFTVTVKSPHEIQDINPMSDVELFGLWDAMSGTWVVDGKLDYDSHSLLSGVKASVQSGDYALAKEKLFEITKSKLKSPVYAANVSKAYSDSLRNAYSNYVTTYGLNMLNPVSIGNNRAWHTVDVKSILSSGLEFNIILQSEMKEDVMVEIDSKESDRAPYILVTLKNGTQKKFGVKRDTTLRAGYYSKTNYGNETIMKVMDNTGYPIDASTMRACMNFEISGIKASDVSKAELYLHGENVSKTGDKSLYVIYNVSEWDESAETWASAKVSDSLYSYSGAENNGFSYSFSPGGDAEVTYQQNGGRLYYLSDIASGFAKTGDEKYAYDSFRLIDNYFKKAGESATYPRGLDAVGRNSEILNAFKLCAGSKYFTPEAATFLWKHIYNQQNEMIIGRDPFWHGNTGNIAISLSEHILKTSIEFSEFKDVSKWIDFYQQVMQPIMESSIFEDGSYIEAADGYGTSSIKTFANSVMEAKNAGISFSGEYENRIHKSAYSYAAQKAPGFANIRFGDSWTGGGGQASDTFLIKMAKLFEDDELLYIATNGSEGVEPENASLYFGSTKRAFMRSEWSKDASYLMINADNGYGGHAHEDDLSVIAFAHGNFVIPDTSVLSYATDDVSKEMKKSTQHNTLGRITDVKTGQVSTQSSSGELGKTTVVNYRSDSVFDYFSANAAPELYDGRNTGYNRKVLFVKPGYWIVSDYVKDNAPGGRGDNKYDIMFHLMPGSNPSVSGTTLMTDSDSADVCLVTPDSDVNLTVEDAYYTDKVGSYVMTKRAVYSKTEDAKKAVTFDTVIFPSSSNDEATVSAERLETGTDTGIASAMHISRKDSNGEFDDYYYYSNERNFDSGAEFSQRSFGNFSFNGELCYQSYNKTGSLESALMISGTRLTKNDKTVISTENTVNMLDIKVSNSLLRINCSEKDIAKLGNVVINANTPINSVYYNDIPVEFSVMADGSITIPGRFIAFSDDETVTATYEAENGEDVIIAIAVYSGNKLTDVDFRIFKDHTGQAKAEIKAGAGCTAKAFLWRGGSFAPLYKSIDVR